MRYETTPHEPALPTPEFTLNQARAFFDADVYREMVAMIGRARRSVRLEFFLFGGPVADEIIDALKQKMAEGVSVRVTLDRARGVLPAVRRECRVTHRRLRAEGIDVILSDTRPFPASPPNRPAVDHSKIIVVDDREALVGGTNVGSLFFRHHDVMIRVEGPAAAALGRQFDFDRQFALDPGRARPADMPPPLPAFEGVEIVPADQSCVRVLGTGIGRRSTRAAIVQNLRAARVSVCIAMSEMGRTDVLDEVIAARDRGVDVRVLLEPQDMTEYLPPWPGALRRRFPKTVLNAGALRVLLDAGIAVRLFKVGGEFALLHLKMTVFDHLSAIVGSTNWTRGGFEWVGETDVEIHGGPVIEHLQAQFSSDWENVSDPAPMPSRSIQTLCRVWERLIQ